ncbi:hypothetical protein ACHAPT_003698 [Fusarium lateritium]
MDLVAFKTSRSRFGWTFLCLSILVFIISMICADSSPPPIDQSAPIVAIMGQTGVGKSAFIDTIGAQHVSTGAAPKVGHKLKSETSKVSWYRAFINGRNVYLIDTLGFDDDTVSDLQILKHISKELGMSYQ